VRSPAEILMKQSEQWDELRTFLTDDLNAALMERYGKEMQIAEQRIAEKRSLSTQASQMIMNTLVDNPPEDSRVVVEEAFGPVLPLLRFTDIDDVIARANDTPYGLAASVWSNDVSAARAIASRLECGTIWINEVHVFGPHIAFGGHKQSGIGVENALEGLAEYTNPRTITISKRVA
jgi:acyl-CoA reductase-like NAD-dependent aldehyde dehydrogenase